MTNIQEIIAHEEKMHKRFENDFKSKYDSIEFLKDYYSIIDCKCTTPTSIDYYEIKQRNADKTIQAFSASTYLESPKLVAFQRIYDHHKACYDNDINCYLLVYFGKDWIKYDITERIRQRSIQLNQFSVSMSSSTMNGGYMCNKWVSSLSFKAEYNDVIYIHRRQPIEKKNYVFIEEK